MSSLDAPSHLDRSGAVQQPDARALMTWARRHARSFPWRRERDPFRLVVTELMLIRTRAEQVARVWDAFFEVFPTLDSLIEADERDVAAALKPLGLEWRARRVLEFARAAATTPNWQESLRSLPGAGPYVSAAAAIAFNGRGELPVDVTIARVVARFFGIQASGEARRDVRVLEVTRLMGQVSRTRFHAWLDLAAAVCKPKAPACGICPLRSGCRTAGLESVSRLNSTSSTRSLGDAT